MATYYGVNRTLANDPVGANRVDAAKMNGKLRVMTDTYEAAALAAGSIIEMGDELPLGSVIVEVILNTDNLQNSTTLKVGDYEDDDRYIDAVDCGSAEVTKQIGTTTGNIDGRLYQVDATYSGKTVGSGTDRQIIITTAVGAATGTIKLAIIYAVE